MKEETWRILFLVLVVCAGSCTYAQKNPDLARTPPMGWNSWNRFGKKDINEQVVREVIDAFVDQGLKNAGP